MLWNHKTTAGRPAGNIDILGIDLMGANGAALLSNAPSI